MHRVALLTCLAIVATIPANAADLVDVATHVQWDSVPLGTANEGSCFIRTRGLGEVRVQMDTRVVFANGYVLNLTGIDDPGVIGYQGAYELSVFFIIPPEAGPGPARFECEVRAQIGGQKELELSSAGFVVSESSAPAD
ncbi:MAG TPA: hypothetical protein VF139_00685 [Candidatus Polarisedimenticolaceae bacterium]